MIYLIMRRLRCSSSICSIVLFGALVLSCQSANEGSAANDDPIPVSSDSAELLFPYIEFIKTELAYLDSTPFAIVRIIAEDGLVKDSSMISLDDAKTYASLFTSIDPNLKQLRPQYREESFVDMTLGYNTFIIEASNEELPLQKATVLVHPESNEVERLILQQKEITDADTLLRMLTWRKQKGLQIVEQFNADKKPAFRTTSVVWDN